MGESCRNEGVAMSSKETDPRAQTSSEWRRLGFFYDYDDSSRAWIVRGSRAGLGLLCSELRAYARNPAHAPESEHEHYGPYSYLKLVTWPEAKIVADGVYGRLDDFERLAGIIEAGLHTMVHGEELRIDSEYSTRNDSVLVIKLEPDDFDPAACDPAGGTP
jgi:hypothetical protein